MHQFHLFFDENQQAIVIENDPLALDAAPYERMVTRGSGLKDAGAAQAVLSRCGGLVVYADGRILEVGPQSDRAVG